MCTTEGRMSTFDEIKMNAGDVAITTWTEQNMPSKGTDMLKLSESWTFLKNVLGKKSNI